MIYSALSPGLFVLRLEDGDDIMDCLRKFADRKRLSGAVVEGIGSLKRARLGYYDFGSREYSYQTFEEDMEIVSLLGNISRKDRTVLPHVHVSLGRKDFTMVGGHLDDGSQANMVEVFVRKTGKLVKVHDEKTGLNLLKLAGKI